jgi:hypothetical protein
MNASFGTPHWCPGLDNGERTLRDVLASMPTDPPGAIPWYVKLLENPASPVALPGAIDLFGHDCIHVLLGRGLQPADEAFVIGFTMGSSGQLSAWQEQLFRWCSAHLYRGRFRFADRDRAVFGLGVWLGRQAGVRPLDAVDFRALLSRPLADIRRDLGVRPEVLAQGYALERQLWTETRTLPRGSQHGLA